MCPQAAMKRSTRHITLPMLTPGPLVGLVWLICEAASLVLVK